MFRSTTHWQYASTAIVVLLMLSAGMAIGWSSPNIPKLLHDPHNPVKITQTESSWVTSFLDLSSGLSALPVVFLMDRLGRLNTLRLAAVPITIAWILIGVADSIAYIYAARLLSGFTLASCLSIMPMYLGEIATPSIRGRITVAVSLAMKAGILLSFSIGPFVSFRAHAFICVAPPVLFLCGSALLTESPYFLLRRDRTEEAAKSLGIFRGMSCSEPIIKAELVTMQEMVKESQANHGAVRDIFRTRGHRRALVIILTLASIQMLCGSQAVLAYSQIIFRTMNVGLDPADVVIILGSLQLSGALVSATIVDRVGRRPLLMFSVIGTTLCNGTVTMYYVLDRWRLADTVAIRGLALAAMLAFIVCFSVGLPCVNLAILSEIFPANLKAIAGLVYTVTTALLAFAVIALFPVVVRTAGSDYAFGTFMVFGVVYSVLIWWLVPETKGKRFEEILKQLESI